MLKTPRRFPHKIPPRLAFSSLVESAELGAKLDQSFASSSIETEYVSSDAQWNAYSKQLYACALGAIGKPLRKNQDWFDSSDPVIQKLVEEHRCKLNDKSLDADRGRALQKNLRHKIRELKDAWWNAKAAELQLFSDTQQTGKFFEGIQAIFGPRVRKTAPMFSRDRQHRVTSKGDILLRWTEHFNDVLNPARQSVDLSYINSLEKLPVCEELCDPPTFDEFVRAVKRLRNSKAPGGDRLPAEVYKYSGKTVVGGLYSLILRVWEKEDVPRAWRDSIICKLYKGKGDVSDCSSYRGISLLSSAGKVLAHIINSRLSTVAETCLPESQCGFRPSRGTIDAIFVVKQLQEKSLEQQQPLYMCFIDLEKAFDRVPREALWIVLEKAGFPGKFINLVRQFHDGMKVQVQHENDLSEEITVTSGVKQGCVMAPSLFSLYFAVVMKDALQSCENRIQLHIRTDGGVFDISRFRARSKVREMPVVDVLYADDVCLMSDNMVDLQVFVDALHLSCQRFGLVISTSKTQILKQPTRSGESDAAALVLGDRVLEEVHHFKYLGTNISSDNTLALETTSRIARAASAFGRLNRRVWRSHDLKLKTKLDVYKALVLSVLMYGAETWCLYKADIKKLDTFHLRCLRSIMGIGWQDRISNTEILRKSQMYGMEALLMTRQLRWCGHVLRMEDYRLPKAVFYSVLANGKRKPGGQHLRYKDVLRRHLNACGIDSESWEELAARRSSWRNTVHKRVKVFEGCRLEDLDHRRQVQKSRPKPSYSYTYDASGQLYCNICDRVFKTKFGFASHIRAHARNNSE